MADGSFIVELVHGAIDALEAERGDEFGGDFKSVIDSLFLLVGPFAEYEVDLRPARVLVPYTEAHARVVLGA